MEVVVRGRRIEQLIPAHEPRRQSHHPAAGDHQHRQISAGADSFPQGSARGPGGTDVALGVFHPILNQLDQLVQEGQGLLVAAHQRFLGEFDGRRFMLAIGEPSLQGSKQILVQLAAGIGQRWFDAVEAGLQCRRLSGFHPAVGFEAEAVGAAAEAESENFIAAGGQQFPLLAWFRQHHEAVVQQPLKSLAPWFQAEAVFPQSHRGVVAIRQAVNDVGAHGDGGKESEGVAVASGDVK